MVSHANHNATRLRLIILLQMISVSILDQILSIELNNRVYRINKNQKLNVVKETTENDVKESVLNSKVCYILLLY